MLFYWKGIDIPTHVFFVVFISFRKYYDFVKNLFNKLFNILGPRFECVCPECCDFGQWPRSSFFQIPWIGLKWQIWVIFKLIWKDRLKKKASGTLWEHPGQRDPGKGPLGGHTQFRVKRDPEFGQHFCRLDK